MVPHTKKVQNPLSHASRADLLGSQNSALADMSGRGLEPWVLCLPRCSVGLVVTLTCSRTDKLCVHKEGAVNEARWELVVPLCTGLPWYQKCLMQSEV